MKKKLLILPLALLMTCAMAQNPTPEKKMPTTTSLDGRSFKITLASSTTGTNTGTPGDVTNHTSGMTPATTDPDHTATGKAESNDKAMNDKESVSNKTTVLRFENGTVSSSFMSMKNLENCPYTVTGSKTDETLSFTATCKNTAGTNTHGNCTWTGTVNGKSINGSLNVVKDDGKNISYTFSGTETDGTKDLGIK